MKFEQKKFSTKITYDFQEDYIRYYIKHSDGSSSFDVPYENIYNDVSSFEEKNSWFKNVGLAWLAISAFEMLIGRVKISIWLILGALFLAIYYIYKINFTKINTQNFNMLVIKDEQHDEILKKIFDSRDKYLISKYKKIDTTSTRDEEINKFKSLKKLGLITEEEYEEYKIAIVDNLK